MHPAPHPAVLYTDTMLLFVSGENPMGVCVLAGLAARGCVCICLFMK